MEILLTAACIAFFIFLINKLRFFKVDGLNVKLISGIFLLKVIAGFAMFLLYTFYYTERNTADIFKYFDDGKVILAVLFENPLHYLQLVLGINTDAVYLQGYLENTNHWFKPLEKHVYNDTRTLIRFNAIVGLFSMGYYQVHNVVINFLSLIGLLAIYKAFLPFLKNKLTELAIGIFLIPSVIFWGSGVLKEGILILGLGLVVLHGFALAGENKSWKSLMWLIVGTLLIGLSKLYILLAFIPAYTAYLIVAKSGQSYAVVKYVAIIFSLLTIGILAGKISPGSDALQIISTKQHDFIRLVDSLNSGSRMEINELEPTVGSFALNSPSALANTFLRPHLLEARSPVILMAAAENTLMVLLLLTCLLFFKHAGPNMNLLLFCLTFVLLLYLLIGLTTPVMGAIVRYKVPALPFLFVALLIIFDKEKFAGKIGWKI